MSQYNYEESVQWLRAQPELQEMVKQCYLDEDNLAAAQRFAHSEEFAAVAQLLDLKTSPPVQILDLGCGNGIVSYAFASLGHNVQAVDPDQSDDVGLGAIAKLTAVSLKGSITTTVGFAEALPFADNSFDIVYTRQAVHHFADLSAGVRECARVLKPGGRLFFTREHVVDNQEQLEAFLDNHILHKLHGGENAYPQQQYLAAITDAGLQITQDLAHYDSVINHFPTPNSEIKEQARQVLEKKFGKAVAALGQNVPKVEQMYRARSSQACDLPGRFHSFLAVKSAAPRSSS